LHAKSLIARQEPDCTPRVCAWLAGQEAVVGGELLWGGEFWSDGYFIASVGQQDSEETVRRYVEQQGQDRNYRHRQLHPQPAT